MASLNSDGTPKTQSSNVFRHHHLGNFLGKTDTTADSGVSISNSGVVRVSNFPYPFGHEYSAPSRTFISGMSIGERNLLHATSGSGIRYIDYLNQASGLTPEHKVTRAMGIHTSVSTRHYTGPSGMVTAQERKVFWLDSDRDKTSSFADWNVFDANDNPIIAGSGTRDIDFSPDAKFDT